MRLRACGWALLAACQGGQGDASSASTADSTAGTTVVGSSAGPVTTETGAGTITSAETSTSETDATAAETTPTTTAATSTTGPASSSTGMSEAETASSDASTTGGNEVCGRGIVHVGDLWITDDTDPATLTCIVEVTGSLHVEDTTTLTSFANLADLAMVGHDVFILDNAALVDLAGLFSLKQVLGEVYGAVVIQDNPALVDISGLHALEIADTVSIRGCDALIDVTGLQGPIVGSEAKEWTLAIGGNDSLADLDGLAGLQDFSGRLIIEDNPVLEDISALELAIAPTGLDGIYLVDNPALIDMVGLDQVTLAREVQLFNNDALISMHGLEGLVASTVNFYVRDNDKLATMAGLEALETARVLHIADNPALTSLAGLDGLTTVTLALAIGACDVGGNDALVDLSGLENLTDVESLNINSNGGLTSLAGLDGLTSVALLFIMNNTALPTADAVALAAQLGVDKPQICNNKGAPAMCLCD